LSYIFLYPKRLILTACGAVKPPCTRAAAPFISLGLPEGTIAQSS
jgi:hypothetical protein